MWWRLPFIVFNRPFILPVLLFITAFFNLDTDLYPNVAYLFRNTQLTVAPLFLAGLFVTEPRVNVIARNEAICDVCQLCVETMNESYHSPV